jgi:hypothetical protein
MTNRTDIAKRAAEELAAATKALQQANMLFASLEDIGAGLGGSKVFLLAQIGAELTASYGERADGQAEFFAGVSHD